MKTKLLKLFLTGALVGLFISICISVAYSISYGGGEYLVATPSLIESRGSELNAFVFQSITSMILGGVMTIIGLIYENDKWGLTKQTMLHLLGTIITVTTIATLNKWVVFNVKSLVVYTLIWMKMYFVIWLANYIYYAITIKKINEKIVK